MFARLGSPSFAVEDCFSTENSIVSLLRSPELMDCR